MLKKMVDGIEVECSPEEEAEIRAEWEANAAKKAEEESVRKAEDAILKNGTANQKVDILIKRLGL